MHDALSQCDCPFQHSYILVGDQHYSRHGAHVLTQHYLVIMDYQFLVTNYLLDNLF